MHEENQALARSVLELLGRLSPANFGKIDLTAVVAAAVPALALAGGWAHPISSRHCLAGMASLALSWVAAASASAALPIAPLAALASAKIGALSCSLLLDPK